MFPIVGGLSATFALSNTNELMTNGSFSSGTTGWQLFATPDMSYIQSNVAGGVFQYFRVAPPAGTTNQAVVFQNTGVALAANAPVGATFSLGNTSSVRKRISVLILDFNFSDLSVCTFWLPPNTPLATYQMDTRTTKAWTNASIYFYAASAGGNGGCYQLDNVSMQSSPGSAVHKTVCADPNAPAFDDGVASQNLLTNGDFSSGSPGPWATFGTIASQIASGVFEFSRPTNVPPAGVVFQSTSQALTAGNILTATLELGNSSSVRKRVTLILHDSNFSDLAACTFWLPPGQPLSAYAMRAWATQAWINATFSVYAATVGTDPWIRMDNATLRRMPSAVLAGTVCAEPGAPFPRIDRTTWFQERGRSDQADISTAAAGTR